MTPETRGIPYRGLPIPRTGTDVASDQRPSSSDEAATARAVYVDSFTLFQDPERQTTPVPEELEGSS